jgi:purine catabolism regulator
LRQGGERLRAEFVEGTTTDMALTVRELTEIPFLRTRIFAGAGGADRTISWAHSVEMPRPWDWLEAGDLLMTVGLGIPVEPQDQVTFVETLAAVGVSGIAIGENMHAPPLTQEMLDAADRRNLPLLFTAFEVPFIQISRTVAASSQGPEHLRLVKTVRIYDSVRAATIRSSSPAELLRDLGDEINCTLSVCTNDRAAVVFEGADSPRADVRAAFLEESARRGGVVPGILRLSVDDATALVVPVPARRAASLIAVPRGSDVPPYAILQHVATVAALELERLMAAREEQRRLGAETLAHILDGRLAPLSAVTQLHSHGLTDGPLVMLVATRASDTDAGGWLHHALAERRIPHMLLRRNKILHCLLSAGAGDTALEEVIELLSGDDIQIGISETFSGTDALPDAVREARWALARAGAEGQRCCRYGEQSQIAGPRSINEARAMVDRAVGPVLQYDAEHGTELIRSLTVFLRCNRSWQQAAAELYVHKQTLVYRMRRVEELLGRKLNDTATIAELWPAISALDVLADSSRAATRQPVG